MSRTTIHHYSARFHDQTATDRKSIRHRLIYIHPDVWENEPNKEYHMSQDCSIVSNKCALTSDPAVESSLFSIQYANCKALFPLTPLPRRLKGDGLIKLLAGETLIIVVRRQSNQHFDRVTLKTIFTLHPKLVSSHIT
jgi:hypothetical protein